MARLNLSEAVEDINDKHSESWTQIQSQDPSLSPSIPISPIIPLDMLQPFPISLSSKKIKSLLEWKAQRSLSEEGAKSMIKGFRDEGNWPSEGLTKGTKGREKKSSGIGSLFK